MLAGRALAAVLPAATLLAPAPGIATPYPPRPTQGQTTLAPTPASTSATKTPPQAITPAPANHHHGASSKDDGHNAARHGQAIPGEAASRTSHPAPHGPGEKTDAHAASPQKNHRPNLKEKLEQAEQDLAGEMDDQKAQSLMKKAETLRLFSVQNGGRLLLTAAQDALKKGHADEAEQDLSAALTLQPNNAFLRRQRAAIRLMGNDLTGAVEDLQQALVKDPGDAQSWDLLAHTQEHLHHPAQALHAYTEALTHAPLLPGGQTRYKKLEEKAHGRAD